VAIVLLTAFILIERRTAFPLVPLSIFRNRSLSVSNSVSLALGASIFSMFFFLSLYMQEVLGYSALRTGIGYLAIASAIIIAAGAAQALVAKVGVRNVMTVGMLLASGGLVYFTQISPRGTYLGALLPGFLLAGVGLGLSFVPVTIGAVSGVVADEAGVASGLITTTQQIGGALGVAVLSTIAVSATTRFARSHERGPQEAIAGLNHGFSIAFWFGALFAVIGAVVAFSGINGPRATADIGRERAVEDSVGFPDA
jgi:predicted MFS family arabinose efflux permease